MVFRFPRVPSCRTIERSTLITPLNGALGIGVTKISSCAESLGTVRKSASAIPLRTAVSNFRRIGQPLSIRPGPERRNKSGRRDSGLASSPPMSPAGKHDSVDQYQAQDHQPDAHEGPLPFGLVCWLPSPSALSMIA